ncbi:MAG: hypothetical protein OXR84_06165 [Magnetovibrio sp.]|nr:hypothetical protein [Magnetovibrio sp.]
MFAARWIIGALFAAALVAGQPDAWAAEPGGPPQLAQSGGLMQCMEHCIRTEGESEKDTCKMRCANISSKRPKQRDCMGIYKQCKRSCAKTDKACARACKGQLMKCS